MCVYPHSCSCSCFSFHGISLNYKFSSSNWSATRDNMQQQPKMENFSFRFTSSRSCFFVFFLFFCFLYFLWLPSPLAKRFAVLLLSRSYHHLNICFKTIGVIQSVVRLSLLLNFSFLSLPFFVVPSDNGFRECFSFCARLTNRCGKLMNWFLPFNGFFDSLHTEVEKKWLPNFWHMKHDCPQRLDMKMNDFIKITQKKSNLRLGDE